MQKIMYGIIATLFLVLCFIFWRYLSVVKDLENETYKNAMLESKLDNQNKTIQKLQLDTQSYKQKQEQQIKETKNKYNNALQKVKKVYINTCDIKELERLKNQELQLKELLKVRYGKSS